MLARKGTKPAAEAPAPASKKSATRRPVVNTLQRTPLRSHLYPLTAALPEDYLAHPLSLVPELENPNEVLSEVMSATAVLVQVIMLVRVAVS
jgi:peroxin-16